MTTDPIKPDYYQVGGIETLDIARELTFCAGSAMKYLVRSSRTDGIHKGDRIQDLKKAQRLIEEEITRLEIDRDNEDPDAAWEQQQEEEEAWEESFAQAAADLTPRVNNHGNLVWGHPACASQPDAGGGAYILIEEMIFQREGYPDAPIAFKIINYDGDLLSGIVGLEVEDAAHLGRILTEAARHVASSDSTAAETSKAPVEETRLDTATDVLPVIADPGCEPTRAHPDDAGLDLKAAVPVVLAPGDYARVPTGVRVAIPEGYVGYITPRSGLAARYGVTVLNAPGTIDAGYRGEIEVLLVNHGTKHVGIKSKQRIVQLVIHPIITPEVKLVDALPSTERGEGGFGSTEKGWSRGR